MFDDFIEDLKVARRHAGLTQSDCGHLIGGTVHQISDLERGIRLPNLRECYALSILYGRSFENLHGPLIQQLRHEILGKIETLPVPESHRPEERRRADTLQRLHHRLLMEAQTEHDS